MFTTVNSLIYILYLALVVKNPPASVGDIKDVDSVPGLGRSPGEGKGNPLQYFCVENPIDLGALWVTVRGVAKNWTWLKWLSILSQMCPPAFTRLPPHHRHVFFSPVGSAQFLHWLSTQDKNLKCKQRSTMTRTKITLWALGRHIWDLGWKKKQASLSENKQWNLDLAGERILVCDPSNLKRQSSSGLCRQHCFHDQRLTFFPFLWLEIIMQSNHQS